MVDIVETTGYDSPDDLRAQIIGLDKLIRELDALVSASTAPRLNKPFRDAFRQWTARWGLFRTEADSYMSRLLSPFEMEERLGQWRESYKRWLADVQKRIAAKDVPIHGSGPDPEKGIDLDPTKNLPSLGTGLAVGALVALGGVVALAIVVRK